VSQSVAPTEGRGRLLWRRLQRNRTVIGFIAGALGVLTLHQALLWVLHALQFAPWQAYRLDPTRPFGVPQLLSSAFWGGAWGMLIYRLALSQVSRVQAWVTAIAAAAFLPTVAAAVLIALHRGASLGTTSKLQALAASIVINGAWGASILIVGDVLTRCGANSSQAASSAASEPQRSFRP
jgi:hypothetical protein